MLRRGNESHTCRGNYHQLYDTQDGLIRSRVDGFEWCQCKRDLLFFTLLVEHSTDENTKTVIGNYMSTLKRTSEHQKRTSVEQLEFLLSRCDGGQDRQSGHESLLYSQVPILTYSLET